MLRRLHPEQPDSFAFTAANQTWAEAQVTKYPEGRQASAIIPLLWRAQEQEGWLTRPAIEHVADMLGMAYIRALEVASFYFMFQLQPVGSVAHIQICGTTSCMICGAEDLIGVCREKIADKPHALSADGKFSWEEVECLGACANAPMAQIGKDYYEDLTAERLAEILDELASGTVPVPGPQNGRYTSEPKSGLTSLKDHEKGRHQYNASVQLATDIGDTVKRIDGTEVEMRAPWQSGPAHGGAVASVAGAAAPAQPRPAANAPADATGIDTREAQEVKKGRPVSDSAPAKAEAAADAPSEGTRPEALDGPRDGKPDDLKLIKGIGPKLEKLCNSMGFYHFDQIANWTAEEIAWVDQNLEGFKGRVSRDNWVAQADTLSKGGETEFASRVKKGDVY
ncbi:NADH-quinone oxidoreductase subunit E [Primorskyibacter aestuariivivens]|uniref:NADH-quinone oxidoreductase subunit E n=1 Tax=Primorskyibacter aestuariivivens TaxID=1888912 RepID=UPI002301B568|nr:NADH-quinone oxidoreductase subunit E [Primorskyibacter aestuariivivens]MDA7428726.1 NADH-quinone oxidoreductase subunit E [Primorskyibacter aestuariivivens]